MGVYDMYGLCVCTCECFVFRDLFLAPWSGFIEVEGREKWLTATDCACCELFLDFFVLLLPRVTCFWSPCVCLVYERSLLDKPVNGL